MTRFNRIRTVLAAVASVILLAPLVSVAQGFPDKDAREISAYALSEAALAKYTQATGQSRPLVEAARRNCDDSDGPAIPWMPASLASMAYPVRRPPSSRRA